MMNEPPEKTFAHLKKDIKTLQLSTLSAEGRPNASYSPFITDEKGNFFIFISQLERHTQDLLANSEVSILLIQDEHEAQEVFARQRISYQCGVEVVTIESEAYEPTLNALKKRFGKVIEELRPLPDFILFRLHPYYGQYIEGFGKAYNLVGENLQQLEHIDISTH